MFVICLFDVTEGECVGSLRLCSSVEVVTEAVSVEVVTEAVSVVSVVAEAVSVVVEPVEFVCLLILWLAGGIASIPAPMPSPLPLPLSFVLLSLFFDLVGSALLPPIVMAVLPCTDSEGKSSDTDSGTPVVSVCHEW